MKKKLAFISSLEELTNKQWLLHLEKLFISYDLLLFKNLEEKDYEQIEVAIVANPDIKEVEKLRNLRWVQSLWAGVEKLVLDLSHTNFGIVRMIDNNMSEVMSDSVLSWTFYLYKNMPLYKKQQEKLLWKEHEIKEKSETTISILGLGKLGHEAALRLKNNGFNVEAWSRSEKKIKGIKTYFANEGLEELLKNSDILISLLPLTQDTKNVLNQEKLEMLKKNASVINFSRAGIFDYKALEVLLDKKHLKHAVLDVFEEEPLNKESSLWMHEDITILPHISAPTNKKTAAKIVFENINEYFVNKKEPLFLDKNKGY